MTQPDQQWDIVSSVGLTALGVAAARAIETHRDDPLIQDTLAARFVDAAHPPVPLPTSPHHERADTPHWRWMADFLAVRSRFFDEFFAAATRSGVRQVVLLAAGLDVRAHRLQWPGGTHLYEVDQPKVLEFKDQVLTDAGAAAGCERHVVDTDLRDDWSSALKNSGFDPSQPTAWLTEGLLPYLPAAAEEQLFATIDELSAPGSRIAVEYVTDMSAMLDSPVFSQSSSEFGFDLKTLWNDEPRTLVNERLPRQGWELTHEQLGKAGDRFGRDFGRSSGDRVGEHCVLASGQRD